MSALNSADVAQLVSLAFDVQSSLETIAEALGRIADSLELTDDAGLEVAPTLADMVAEVRTSVDTGTRVHRVLDLALDEADQRARESEQMKRRSDERGGQ